MKLTCGFIQIDSKTLNSKDKNYKYSGQICVDGIETFLVYKTLDNDKIKYFPYGKREFSYEQVIEHYGDELDKTIEELVVAHSAKIKSDKKQLSFLRKESRQEKSAKKKAV
jgi:hypothetical protein